MVTNKMSKREYSIILIINIIVVSFFIASDYELNKNLSQYSKDSIHVNHEATTDVAKINMKDTYTKNGVKFFEFTTTQTKDNLFTMTEEEYDELIGLENDAVDVTTYSLKIDSDILTCKNNFFGCSVIDSFSTYIKKYNGKGNLKSIGLTKNNYYIENENSKDRVRIDISTSSRWSVKDNINTSISKTRYSLCGERDFTQTEIESYTNELDEINKGILECFSKRTGQHQKE